jgi:hypothetical protein
MLQNEEKKAILERAKEVFGLSGHGSDKALAKRLEVSQTVLAAWKTRNNIDLSKLKEKMTPSEFVYVMGGEAGQAIGFGPEAYVSRTEFLEHMLRMSKRIDRLEAALNPESEGSK